MRPAAYRAHTWAPKRYKDAALRLPDRIRNAEAFSPSWGNATHYALRYKVGRGRFGEVYRGVHVPSGRDCVIKIVKPVGKTVMQRLRREYGVMQALAGGPFVSHLLDVVLHQTTNTPALVYPWMENVERRELQALVDSDLLRFYMFRLLQALDWAHERGVMHRDVKPGNVLLDLATRQFRLIDWGLADFYLPGVERNTRISTRPFKAPELQLGVGHYDYAVDVWAAGCTMASLLFDRHPFFYRKGDAESKTDPLLRHAQVLGTDELERFMRAWGLNLTKEQLQAIRKRHPRVAWSAFMDDKNRHRCTEDAFDLLDELLR